MPYCKFQDDTESYIRVWVELDNLAVLGVITVWRLECYIVSFRDKTEIQIKVWAELDSLAV